MQRAASNSDVETRNSFEILLSSCTTLSAAVHVPVDSNGDLSKRNPAGGRTEVKKFALHLVSAACLPVCRPQRIQSRQYTAASSALRSGYSSCASSLRSPKICCARPICRLTLNVRSMLCSPLKRSCRLRILSGMHARRLLSNP